MQIAPHKIKIFMLEVHVRYWREVDGRVMVNLWSVVRVFISVCLCAYVCGWVWKGLSMQRF